MGQISVVTKASARTFYLASGRSRLSLGNSGKNKKSKIKSCFSLVGQNLVTFSPMLSSTWRKDNLPFTQAFYS